MSYEKTNWKTGDVITAEKLNNMEGGISNAGEFCIVRFTGDTTTANAIESDISATEITEAMANGKVCIGFHSLVMDDLRLADQYGFIKCMTGTCIVTFGDTSFSCRSGNEWSKA